MMRPDRRPPARWPVAAPSPQTAQPPRAVPARRGGDDDERGGRVARVGAAARERTDASLAPIPAPRLLLDGLFGCLDVAVALPAALVRAARHLLADRADGHARSVDAERSDVLPNRVGAAIAEGDVVFLGAARIRRTREVESRRNAAI